MQITKLSRIQTPTIEESKKHGGGSVNTNRETEFASELIELAGGDILIFLNS